MERLLMRIWWYLTEMLPLALVALGVLFVCRPWRKRRLARLGLASSRAREVVLAFFVAFCAGLAALTLFPGGFWDFSRLRYGGGLWDGYRSWPEIVERLEMLPEMLTPFQEIARVFRAWAVERPYVRAQLWLLLLGNIVMFMPLGFFPALLWRRWRRWKSLLVGFWASFTIEFTQFFIGRFTDIDDVILNTAGALAGYGLYRLFRRLWPRAAEICKVREVSTWT